MTASEQWQENLETETRSSPGQGSGLPTVQVPGLTILSHPDPGRVGACAALPGLARGETATLSRLEPLFAHPAGGKGRPLGDPLLSRRPMRWLPRSDGGLIADATGTKTPVTIGAERIQGRFEISRKALDDGVAILFSPRIALLLHWMEPIVRRPPTADLIGESPAMVRLRREIERVADLKMPVLLRGESGTGKELVARAIQKAGPLHNAPYLAINMAAIPPTLASAELFGAARGAFSGADRRRKGYFQRADGGTLFLDEIGEMPPEVQVLLLRALETGEIQPVGAEMPRRIDVRVLAATDSDLEGAIQVGKFRAPLLHRLSSYEIVLPTLRARREDIGRLFYHFLRQELEEVGEPYRLVYQGPHATPWVDASIVGRLAAFDWPGNVRQLRNVVRQLVVASRGAETLRMGSRVAQILENPADLPAADSPATPQTSVETSATYRDSSDVPDDELIAALRAHRWRIQPAAAALGLSRGSLYARIEQCSRIRKASDLERDEIERAVASCNGSLDAMVETLEVSKHGLKMRMRELGLR